MKIRNIKTGITFIFLVFSISISIDFAGQNKNKELFLSKQKMYAEMDSLISIIENSNPHLNIYKEVMNLDVIEEIKKQREKIKDVKVLDDYYKLINNSLKIIPEIHCRLIESRELDEGSYFIESYPKIFDETTIESIKIFYDELTHIKDEEEKLNFNHMAFTLYIHYKNGEYFVTRPLIKLNENDSVRINVGLKLIKINDETVDDFILKNSKENSIRWQWDLYNRRFFTEKIIPYNIIIKNTPLHLTFIDPKTNKEIKCLHKKYEKVPNDINKIFMIIDGDWVLGNPHSFENRKPIVRMIDSVLYINIPSMNLNDITFYINEIPAVAKSHTIEKVIVDVRRNRGGSDFVWNDVLSLITDTTLCRYQKIGINDHPFLQDFFPNPIDSLPLYYDKNLKKNYRLLSDSKECINIEPHENSINYKGKIYVLHDRFSYSAANSLVTFALGNDKVVAVGEPTGFQSGYGFNPFIYTLPYSKLCFTMHSVIHIPPDSDDIEDYLWNKTEIPVKTNIIYENIMEEYQMRDYYFTDFFYNYDVYFQAVINDKE